LNASGFFPPARLAFSLLPVLIFLVILIWLDSFKLIRLRAVLRSVCLGGLAALISLLLNSLALRFFNLDLGPYSRYAAPIVEETCKAVYIVYMIKSSRVGFMVDSAIHGFAVGAGFACVENIYYLQSLSDPNLLLWIVRGFGTAINQDRRGGDPGRIEMSLDAGAVVRTRFRGCLVNPRGVDCDGRRKRIEGRREDRLDSATRRGAARSPTPAFSPAPPRTGGWPRPARIHRAAPTRVRT
jgi:hypothetical protein